MRATAVFLYIFVFVGANVHCQEMAKTLDQYYQSLNEDYEMNGNVAASQDGRTIYQRSFGFADVASNTRNDLQSQFELASVSKLFTAIAILQLKEKGLIELDTAFQHYFPSFPYQSITIRHLLAHTSGLPDVEMLVDSLLKANPQRQFTITDELQNTILYSRTHNLLFKPGEKWSYSSAGYHLLALLIEKFSQQPLGDYMRVNIFQPAGMRATYVQTSMAQKTAKHRVKNYQYNNHYEMRLQFVDTLNDWKEWTYNLALETGGSGIISTSGDMLRFDAALSKGNLLKAVTLQEAFTPYQLNNGQPAQPFDLTYSGLGWFIFKDTAQGVIVWGSGANPGTISFFARNLTRHQCFVVLHNVKCNPFNDIAALGILAGQPVTYKASLGFLYARILYANDAIQARHAVETHLQDTLHYALREADLDRAALEFRRAGLKEEALNTCLEHVHHFPHSPDSYKDYGRTLAEYGRREEAIAAFKKVLTLQADDQKSKDALRNLLGTSE